MSDDHTDSAIVESIVSIHIEERILQDTSREADFVGSGIIVGIHRLGCHIPVVAINGLTHRMLDIPGIPELGTCLHIFVIRFGRIDLQLRKIRPPIRIAHLYIEGIQLQKSIHLRRIVHPVLGSNTLTKGNLQILHQIDHTLLGGLWEIFL